MSFSTPDIAFIKPTPIPSPMFPPIPANTVEGEWIPNRLFAPSTIPEKKPLTLSAIHEPRDLMPSHRPVTIFLPISNTAPTAFPRPTTMAVIISGNFATSWGMAFISPNASCMVSSMPISMMRGKLSVIKSMIVMMISGRASISSGSAFSNPSASPCIMANAASRI